jgi:hypothetical protein
VGGRRALPVVTRHPPFSYVLPIAADEAPSAELTEYLAGIARRGQLVVVDGSPPDVFAAAHDAWSPWSLHIRPDPRHACVMGKVQGVLTGLDHVQHDIVVIADDDVRYGGDGLDAVVDALGRADVVVPQNYFDPLPWHARWDTARTLLNRASGGDFPGTLGVRTSVLRAAGGYDGDVMFENLELMRTVEAAGGTCERLDEVYVRRLPPTTKHFLRQRVRQAYDELARPLRLAVWLLVLPVALIAGRRWPRTLPALAAAPVVVAELGRRRGDARRHFPATSSLLAPLWVAERATCAWIAIGARLRGGIPYRGRRIRCAAHSMATLRARQATRLRDVA